MRKPNTNKAVALNAVPERRTERCSPRFRPGGRFCELRLRYHSPPTGREGEISGDLDHIKNYFETLFENIYTYVHRI